jgi:hypothetical protein
MAVLGEVGETRRSLLKTEALHIYYSIAQWKSKMESCGRSSRGSGFDAFDVQLCRHLAGYRLTGDYGTHR